MKKYSLFERLVTRLSGGRGRREAVVPCDRGEVLNKAIAVESYGGHADNQGGQQGYYVLASGVCSDLKDRLCYGCSTPQRDPSLKIKCGVSSVVALTACCSWECGEIALRLVHTIDMAVWRQAFVPA